MVCLYAEAAYTVCSHAICSWVLSPSDIFFVIKFYLAQAQSCLCWKRNEDEHFLKWFCIHKACVYAVVAILFYVLIVWLRVEDVKSVHYSIAVIRYIYLHVYVYMLALFLSSQSQEKGAGNAW